MRAGGVRAGAEWLTEVTKLRQVLESRVGQLEALFERLLKGRQTKEGMDDFLEDAERVLEHLRFLDFIQQLQ
jgi:hypothetical protein